jgi:chloramphenicol 3-O phosphotransferase
VGKSAVASELQRSLSGPWLLAGVDMFWGMLDEPLVPSARFRTDSEVMRRVTRGWHRAVTALAAEGNDVIVDDLWTHRWWLEDWREVLKDFRFWFVKLTASADALAEREAGRGDRPEGLAAADLARHPPADLVDFVIDTTEMTVAQCAVAITDLIGLPVKR